MANVYSTTPLFPDLVEKLETAGHCVSFGDADEQDSTLDDADALICLLGDRIDRAWIARHGKTLSIIANVAVGYENIDLDAASERGIIVTNTPDVLTESTADFTMALLLAAARRVAEADATVRAGRFPPWGLDQELTGIDVHGKTLGIVGMGRIGSAVARRAALGFDMHVVYCSRSKKPSVERTLGATYRSFDDLLRVSDFVSVHVPLTPETLHLLGRDALGRMKPSAILVNVSRGAVLDEAALVDALRAGELAGAALDVFEREPQIHPGLLELRERVVLSPHLGSATRETRHAMAELAVRNVLAVLSGDPPVTPVRSRP